MSRFAKGRANKEIYEKYGIPRNKPIVLYVGRVDPEKSIDVLMEAFIQAHPKMPDAHFVVTGDGTARPKLEKMAEKAGLADYVHFLGRVIGDDLPQIYRTGTLFATASKTETQGIVLLEAMAAGLPCIAVDKGAVGDVVKNTKNGYLCQPDDVDEIAKSLVRIITDKDRQKRMSEDSLKRIRQHDISYTLTRFEEIYNKVLDEHDKEL